MLYLQWFLKFITIIVMAQSNEQGRKKDVNWGVHTANSIKVVFPEV